MLKESDLIRSLQKHALPAPAGVWGMGDDAAVLPFNDQESYVLSKDLLVEDRHFRRRYFTPEDLAHKTLHVNLSDIAAMGAAPVFVMMGIALPASIDADWAERFTTSFTQLCAQEGVCLIGGDTTASERDLFLSITIIGRAPSAHLKFRKGAGAGDILCLAGSVGESYAGLIALEKNVPGLETLKAKTLRPQARVREGLWLGEKQGVTAMMDVSDGLYIDLSRLMENSERGARVAMETLAPSPLLREGCAALGLDPVDVILTGGEDYALLFSVKAEGYESLAKAFHTHFGYPLQRLGVVEAEKGIRLYLNNALFPFTGKPFSHFGESTPPG